MSRKEVIKKIKKMTYKDDFRAFVKSLNLSRDDYKTMMEYIDEIPAVQPDHNANVSKKVSISCSQENDLISRQAALKELAVYIHLIDKTMGKGTLTDDDCMEAAKSVLGEDELPAAQPERKPGRWKEHIFEGIMGGRPRALMCTHCNSLSLHATNFCPNCGADMRGGDST